MFGTSSRFPRKFPVAMVVAMAAVAGVASGALALLLREPDPETHKIAKQQTVSDERPADLVVGLVPEQNIFEQRKRYKTLLDYIGKQVGVRIGIRSLRTYGEVIQSLENRSIDAAFVGSFAYVLAHDRTGAIVVARPLWLDGSSTYEGLIFVRANDDPPITNCAQMRGKILALADHSTTAGYVFPMAYFRDHGIKDIHKYFSNIYPTVSHDATILAVLDGLADAGAAKNHVMDRMLSQHPEYRDKLRIIARSSEMPSNGLVFHPDVPQELREKIKQALLDLDTTPEGRAVAKEFGAKKFIVTNNSNYANLYEMVHQIGVDLRAFDLSKE